MMEDFKGTIREAREQLGLTQEELALRLNVSQKSVSKYERGDRRPTYETLVKMAKLFEVSTDYLLGIERGESMEEFKNALKCARRNKGLTQEQLAQIVGVSSQVVSNWERGYTTMLSLDMVNKIAQALDISLDEFLGTEKGISMNRVKELREQAGMKQSELGKLLGVQEAAISKYEAGKIPLTADALKVLSEIFGVSVDYILGADDLGNDDRYSAIGEKIKFLRKRKAMSQQELGDVLGVSASAIGMWEQGRRFPDVLMFTHIANFFNVTTDYLTAEDGIHINSNIKLLREERGETQAELAEILDISRSTLAGYESEGKQPSYSVLVKISDHFGISIGAEQSTKTLRL